MQILKDIVNRSKLLAGYRLDYAPGWDCHGLPIELKALTASNASSSSPSNPSKPSSSPTTSTSPAAAAQVTEATSSAEPSGPLELRARARAVADMFVERQARAFEAMCVLAHWRSPDATYRTMDARYVCRQLDAFLELHRRGLVYRSLLPVYWSPSSKSDILYMNIEITTLFHTLISGVLALIITVNDLLFYTVGLHLPKPKLSIFNELGTLYCNHFI